MSRRVAVFFSISLGLLLLLGGELIYLYSQSTKSATLLEKKLAFVRVTTLPDLSLSQEPYLRHRTLSGVFATYPVDGALREYAKESFILSKIPIKVN